MTVVVADGCEAATQLLKKFHAFDVNGSKRFECQWDERVRLLKINVLVLLPGGGVIIIVVRNGLWAVGQYCLIFLLFTYFCILN